MKIQLLKREKISTPEATTAQSQLYNFLLERTLAGQPTSKADMIKAMDCLSFLPIQSRLEHLEKKGLVSLA